METKDVLHTTTGMITIGKIIISVLNIECNYNTGYGVLIMNLIILLTYSYHDCGL